MRSLIDLLSGRPGGHEEWVEPHCLEYMPLNEQLAVVRLVAEVERGTVVPTSCALVAGTPKTIIRTPALGGLTHRPARRSRAADELLWRVTFALPLEVVEYPEAVFGLVAAGLPPGRLPQPVLSTLAALSAPWATVPGADGLLASLSWRRAAALGTAAAVAGSSVFPPAAALAAGHRAHHGLVLRAHRDKVAAPAASPAKPSASGANSGGGSLHHRSASVQVQQAASRHRAASVRHHPGSRPARHARHLLDPTTTPSPTTPTSSPSTSTTGPTLVAVRHHHRHQRHPAASAPSGSGSQLSSISTTPPAGLGVSNPAAKPTAPDHGGVRADHGGVRPDHHRPGRSEGNGGEPGSGGATLPTWKSHPSARLKAHKPSAAMDPDDVAPPSTSTSAYTPGSSFWSTGLAANPTELALLRHLAASSAKLDQPPAFLIPIYKRAAKRYHIPWEVLAAINSIETNYGRDLNVSPAGAVGWMQFMPATWSQYGVAADGHGPPNPYNPPDAIFSAARYLAANGGARHLRRAIFAYNHALWYVDTVLWRAGLITDHAKGVHRLGGYSLPLDGRYMHSLGRTDDGVDIENAPDGAAVYSITPGVVTAVASDPSGFGPNYPVIRATKGPLAGQYIYYGHVAASLVKPGQHVKPGQPIAVMGHTGDAAGLGHGHIEIGFSDGHGDPLNHHGAAAWTPAGAAMRKVLIALAAGFHIKTR